MNELGINLMKALDRVFTPPPPTPAQRFEAQARRLAAMAPTPLETTFRDPLLILKSKQDEHVACTDAMNSFTQAQAKQGWVAWEEKLKAAVRAGTDGEIEAWTYEDFRTDYYRRCELSKLAAFDVSREASKLAQPIAKRFQELCNSLALEVESREKSDASRFGIPHTPSATVLALRQTGVDALQRCSAWNASPKSMLPYVDF